MKRINLCGLLLFNAILLINSGCTEDTLATGSPTSTPPTVIQPSTPPTAFAGEDFQLILPTDFCWLSGAYSEDGNIKVEKLLWKKLSGPASYLLGNPDSLRTKVSNLEKGIYEFELTVTNTRGLTGKDISRVVVGEMSSNPKEIIFKDLIWNCDWDWGYCELIIKNIYNNLPAAGSVFRIYLQRDGLANWEEVIHGSSQSSADARYTYILYNGDLIIYPHDFSEAEGKPNIKIVY